MGVPPLVLNMTMEMSFDNLTADTKIPKTSQYRMSPLHEVLWFNNLDDIEEFIKTSSEENELGDLLRTYDRDARSPLMYAIINKNTKALKLLLEAGAPVNYQDPQQGYTALIYAIYHGFREGVEILLGRDINVNFTTKGRKPTTPLLFAAARGYSQTVAKLLDKGADINATFPVDDETQFNALMVAMHSDEITDLPIRQAVCEILIAHGINTLIPRSDGCSPMMCAIDKRMVDVAKLLIERGITNIDKVANDKCTTALWVSMQRKNLECVKLLMDNNVKIQTGKSRSSPLHAAVISNFTEGVQILLDHDHPLMWMDTDGFTPIHYAACFEDTTVLEMLLKKGLNVEVKAKKSGYTPLVIACLKGNVNGIKKLLDYNASIEAFDKKDGVTPLIATIIENKLEATEYLISRGANIMGRRGGKGITPLMNAIGLQRTAHRNLILAHAKEKAEKKGELKKQGGGHRSKAWKKRYFVLYGTYFLYYKDERAVEPQGIIVLDGCDVTDSSKGALNFVIVTPRRSYQVQSKSEEERNSWFQFISTAVKSYQKPDDLPSQSFGADGKVPDTNVNS